MAELMAVPKMGRKKAPENAKRDDKAVKIDRTIADQAGLVSSRRGVSQAEYLSDLLRKAVASDFAKAIAEMGGKP